MKAGISQVQGTPLTREEEMMKMADPDFIRLVERALNEEEVFAGGPTADVINMVKNWREMIRSVDIWKKYRGEIVSGPASRRGGPFNYEDFVPIFEEAKEGIWEKAMFKGQAGLAVGTSNVVDFVKKRIMTGLALTLELTNFLHFLQ